MEAQTGLDDEELKVTLARGIRSSEPVIRCHLNHNAVNICDFMDLALAMAMRWPKGKLGPRSSMNRFPRQAN